MIQNTTAEGVFLNLVRSIINDEKPSGLPDGITADDIFTIGSRQDMAPITFCALNSISPKPVSQKWGEHQKRFFDDCMRSEVQMSEYYKLVEFLCENGVKIIPLKGCVIKELYITPNLRAMSDVDLLYEGVTEKELSCLMEACGYSTENLEAGCHDVFYKKPCMNIELHRKLVVDNSPYKPVLDNMFEKAIPDEKIPNLFHMKPEDLYIHVIVHAAKHFMGSGIGVRPVGDIFVLNKKYSESWDRGYIERQLQSVELDRFEEKIRDVANTFFGKEEKELSKEDMSFFFRGSTYGNYGDAGWSYMSKGGKSRWGHFLYRSFLPYPEMCNIYPVLKKWPILLPFAWIYRIVDVLFHRRNNVARIVKAKVNAKEAEYVSQLMDEWGLND